MLFPPSRGPRRRSPRTEADFRLLATVAANEYLTWAEIAARWRLPHDDVEALVYSPGARGFARWLGADLRPEALSAFRLPTDRERELAGRPKAVDPRLAAIIAALNDVR